MNQTIDPVLFTDPQAAVPLGFCGRCGGEIYSPGPDCGCGTQEDDHDPA
jgi:hypothetical protein